MASISVALILCILNIFLCTALGNQQVIKIAAVYVVNMKIQDGRRIYVKQVNPGQKGKTPTLRSVN